MYIIKGNSKIYIYDFDDDGSTPKQSLNVVNNPDTPDEPDESDKPNNTPESNKKVIKENFKSLSDIDWTLVVIFIIAIILILALMAWFIFKNKDEQTPEISSMIAVSSLENVPVSSVDSQLVRPISTMSISPSYASVSPQTTTDYARVPELKKFVVPMPEGKSHGHHKHKKASPKKKRCLV